MLFRSSANLDQLIATYGEPSGVEHGQPWWWIDIHDPHELATLDSQGNVERTLYYLSVNMPLADTREHANPGPPGRAFRYDDRDALLAINNRAFDWHPDQANWTVEQLDRALEEPWVDFDQIRTYHDASAMVGFCWLRDHESTDTTEIFLIAVDPSLHGRGLGRYVVTTSLDWAALHHPRGMAGLWVESTNVVALALYSALGFERQTTRVKLVP